MEYKILFVIFLLLSIPLNFLSAHLDNGKDITKDGYIIDFGYSPANLSEGLTSNFAINLVNETTGKPTDITSIWVRISNPDKVVFAGEFAPENASTAFTYVFPGSGNYVFDTKFYNNENLVEQQSFNVSVGGNNTYYGLLLIVLAVFIISFLIIKKQSKNESK